MTDDTKHEQEDEALAAEYVIGLLAIPERTEVEGRRHRDRAFAARVVAWEDYFAGLNDDYGMLQPSQSLKSSIDRRLFPRPRRDRAWWVAAGVIATVLIAAIVFFATPFSGPAPWLVAQLESSENDYRFAVEVTANGAEIDIALASGAAVGNRIFELWLIPPDGVPRSLGTFTQEARLLASDAGQILQGSILAVSLEPIGGSPTGAPTGPVLALGMLRNG